VRCPSHQEEGRCACGPAKPVPRARLVKRVPARWFGSNLAEFMNALDSTSTRPYLIRALYEWCTDNGFTPYVAVSVDDSVQVPREYVKNNEIVLNISFDATSSLKLGNDFIEFKARFAGSAREIMVPISHVIAIYARENGQGMAFPMAVPAAAGPISGAETGSDAGLTAPAASAAPAPAHGTVDGPEGKIMQLVPDSASDAEEGDPDTPEPPKPPRARPSLKRVK
jgi:stringent starvation protein B